MWSISKQFDFCYGHRVWTQELNQEYSLDTQTKCRHLHGHQGKIIVHLKSNSLSNGMVTDFKHLNWFKKWLDDVLDHKFIIDREDPLFNILLPFEAPLELQPEGHLLPKRDFTTYKEVGELYDGMVIVDFTPTSENLCKWLFDIIQEKMIKIGVVVDKVEFFETPKSQSVYHS